MTRSSISVLLLLVGFVWAAIVSFALLAAGTSAADLGETFLMYSWLFIGPLLLVGGTILATRTHPKLGSALALVGCVILTVTVGYQSISMLKGMADPLLPNKHLGAWAVGVFLTLLADVGAVQLYRGSRPIRV